MQAGNIVHQSACVVNVLFVVDPAILYTTRLPNSTLVMSLVMKDSLVMAQDPTPLLITMLMAQKHRTLDCLFSNDTVTMLFWVLES